MKTHAPMVILVGAVALLVAALAPPGGAAAQPQPTIVLSPSSGPCDAPVEASGTGLVPRQDALVYLLQPGTTDVSMGLLTYGSVDQNGAFSQWFGLREHGCEAAVLDSQAEEPAGYLAIVAAEGGVQPGEHIPNIIATARYEYTTTAPRAPIETLSISPGSGPCDAGVEVTGSGFQAGIAVVLKLASASGEFGLGPLASAAVGSDGQFKVHFRFGQLGCGTASLVAHYTSCEQFVVGAFPAVYPTPTPPGPPDPLAVVRYTFTTTAPIPAPAPRILPATGTGPHHRWTPVPWVPLMGGVALLGATLIVVSLYGRREHH